MADFNISPLAPARFPMMPLIEGLRFSTTEANIKYPNREDLLLFDFDVGTTLAGVFTQSSTVAAPVAWSRIIANRGYARGLLINSGNANAFTGDKGREDVESCAVAAARLLGCSSSELLVASTGVIGEPLPVQRIVMAIENMKGKLQGNSWERAALAIGTTDTYPKGAACVTEIDGVPIQIAGIAKGSGMIAPNMATMLAFIFTDASLPPDILRSVLKSATSRTFNCITVDSDTSTSDMVLLFSTGRAGNIVPTSNSDKKLKKFKHSLNKILENLALQVVRDGEGAKKLITIEVLRAKTSNSAHKIGMAIANSPLVKTAIAGEDANWGRIVMAVGKTGIVLDQSKLLISIGGVLVTENGKRVDNYDEVKLTSHLKSAEILLQVDLGEGNSNSKIWTCDFTHDYIRINADYRT
tara:strand:+ start:34693 stop:35928 length:1236 start_codon:yes stop_codon:yes gene_type:complete